MKPKKLLKRYTALFAAIILALSMVMPTNFVECANAEILRGNGSYYWGDGGSEKIWNNLIEWSLDTESGTLTVIGSGEVCYGYWDEYISCIQTLVIGEGITAIKEYAFAGYWNLKDVVLSDTVKNIGSRAFYNCEELENINIPSGVVTIGDNAFTNCDFISITIPESITTIGSAAFEGNRLDVIYNNSNIELTIGSKDNGAVAENAKAIVNKDGTITYVDESGYEFGSEYLLTSNGFLWEHYVESVETDGEEVIKHYSYRLSSYIGKDKTLEMPKDINGNSYDFYNFRCRAENIIFPESIKTIKGSLYSCANIKSISIPASATKIDIDGLSDTYTLESITIADENPVYSGKGNCITEKATKTLVAGCKASVIPDDGSVEIIDENAFPFCNITSINIPANVKYIASTAFRWCVALESITVSEGNSHYYSTGNCLIEIASKKLVKAAVGATMPDDGSIEEIGDYSLEWDWDYLCRNNFNIPQGVTKIGAYTFYNQEFSSITLPQSLTFIAENAFDYYPEIDVIYNNSNIELQIGGSDNGNIAKNAKAIVNNDGTITYATESDGTTYLLTDDKFLFSVKDGKYTLIAYAGNGNRAVLPENVNGENYNIQDFRGALEVVLPDNVKEISNMLFGYNANIKSVYILAEDAEVPYYYYGYGLAYDAIFHVAEGSIARQRLQNMRYTLHTFGVVISEDGQTAYFNFECEECGYLGDNKKVDFSGIIKVDDSKIYEFVDGRRVVIEDEYITIDDNAYHVVNDVIEAFYPDAGLDFLDFDKNKKINEADAEYLLMATYFLDFPINVYFDPNNDGVWNSDDAIAVKNIIKNIGESLDQQYQ